MCFGDRNLSSYTADQFPLLIAKLGREIICSSYSYFYAKETSNCASTCLCRTCSLILLLFKQLRPALWIIWKHSWQLDCVRRCQKGTSQPPLQDCADSNLAVQSCVPLQLLLLMGPTMLMWAGENCLSGTILTSSSRKLGRLHFDLQICLTPTRLLWNQIVTDLFFFCPWPSLAAFFTAAIPWHPTAAFPSAW